LIFVWSINWQLALVDALIFTLLYAVMGIAVWYIVKFSGVDSANLVNTLVTHLVAGALLVFGVVFIAETAIPILFAEQANNYAFNSDFHAYRLVIGALLYVLIAINFYLVIYYEEFRSKRLREQELDQHLKSAELNMLKAQINPHFIFNSLNSISSLTLTDPEKAHEMVIHLADFLRYSIRKNADQLVPLSQEIEAIELFMAIEKKRYGDRLAVKIACDETARQGLVPALILQPLVENAIKYSLHETDIASSIDLQCQWQDNYLEVSIANNYDKESIVRKGEGIGLKNVRSRLGIVFGMTDLLKIEDSGNRFKVILKFP
jgi:sensor histidine kinase YesM